MEDEAKAPGRLTFQGLDVSDAGVRGGEVAAEPGDGKRKPPSTVFLAGSLAGGNLIAMVLHMAGGILQARLVVPATLGLFNGIGLALGYAPFLQLGVLNGLNRELPYFVGKGDRKRVEELAAAAQAWALLVGGLVFLALLGVAAWQLVHGEGWKAAGWAANAILAVYLFYSTNYLQATFRTSHDFARLALVTVLESTLGLALLSLVALFNFYGLCLRAVLTGAASTVLLFYWRPVRVGPKWNARHLKHLLAIGLPIFGVGILYSWWGVINSTLVLKLAGTKGMGLYSMVLVAGAALEVVPLAVSQVIYPRMAEQHGRGEPAAALFRIAWKPMVLTFLGLIPVVIAGWWLVGPAVHLVVPAYGDAVPAMRWSLLMPLASSFGAVNVIFNVLRRQDLYVGAMLVGMVVNGASLMWLLRGHIALEAFPQAMLVGRVLFVSLCYVAIAFLVRCERARAANCH